MKINVIATGLFMFLIGMFIGSIIQAVIDKKTSHVEENDITPEVIKVDSFIEHNHNIKITVDNLKTEKENAIKEVHNLDNDSTVKLFYKLLQE